MSQSSRGLEHWIHALIPSERSSQGTDIFLLSLERVCAAQECLDLEV